MTTDPKPKVQVTLESLVALGKERDDARARAAFLEALLERTLDRCDGIPERQYIADCITEALREGPQP